MSADVFPVLPADAAVNSIAADAHSSCYGSPALAAIGTNEYLAGLGFCDLRGAMARASRLSVARHLVCHVLLLRASIEVSRVHAKSLVASVIHLKTVTKRTVSVLPGNNMRASTCSRFRNVKLPIPAIEESAPPRPTLVRTTSIHLGPESLLHCKRNSFWRTMRATLCSSGLSGAATTPRVRLSKTLDRKCYPAARTCLVRSRWSRWEQSFATRNLFSRLEQFARSTPRTETTNIGAVYRKKLRRCGLRAPALFTAPQREYNRLVHGKSPSRGPDPAALLTPWGHLRQHITTLGVA